LPDPEPRCLASAVHLAPSLGQFVGEVLKVVESLADEGMTLLRVTHEMNFARKVAIARSSCTRGASTKWAPPSRSLRRLGPPNFAQFLSALH